MPHCDFFPCQNFASHSWLDFVEVAAPHWWLWPWYPKFELMDESDRRYGCPLHPIFQQLRMLDGRMVHVPPEFPRSRIEAAIKDAPWAIVWAIICAALAGIYWPRLAEFPTIVRPNWILGTLLLALGLLSAIIGERSFHSRHK
jgi:hypothetical protein